MKLRQRFNWLICLMISTGLPASAQMNPDQLREVTKNLCSARFTFSEVNVRLAQLTQQLDAAAAAATLSSTEVADIQARLKHIAVVELQLKQKKESLTFVQALNITRDLNRIAVRLRDANKFKASSLDDVASVRKSLAEQIDSAVSGVLLTRSDATKLTSELNEVKTAETSLRHSATATAKQIQGLVSAVQRVNAHFAQNLKLTQSALADLNKREADLEILIDNASQNESITQKDATAMRHHLDQITATQTSIVDMNTDGPLSSAQIFLLAGQIDSLQAQLEKLVGSATPLRTRGASGLTPFAPATPVQKPASSTDQ